MKTIQELNQTVKRGLEQIKKVPNLIEGVVYASSNRRSISRIVYTSHLPCNGLEEPKSDEDFGVSVELWFRKGNKKYIGFGQESNDLNSSAVESAIAKALRDAVSDPDFFGFYHPQTSKILKQPLRQFKPDKKLLAITHEQEAELLAKLAWDTIAGASQTLYKYAEQKHITPDLLGFILNGDHFLISERMAVANTNGVCNQEESSVILSFFTAVIEKENAKGSAWSVVRSLQALEAKIIGKQAAEAAIKNVGGRRLNSGQYTVIFGPQAVTELFGSLLLPHLSLSMVDFGASLFQGQFGKQVTSSLLSIADDPTFIHGAGGKRITCEGAPTKRTQLIQDGKLVGYLSDSRTSTKLIHKRSEAKRKLGADPKTISSSLYPGNGFRFSRGGGRIASSTVGIHATNLMIESSRPATQKELLHQVGDGIYIGRLWYTYPVGGYASGIISGTVIADSFFIRGGKLAEPLLPNTVRIEDNLLSMVNSIQGITSISTPTILWASDEVTHAPWVAIKNVHLFSINKPLCP